MEALSKLNAKYLISPKLLYFFVAMTFYTLHHFRTTFIRATYNETKGAVGIKFSLVQLTSFIANLWIGATNDRLGKQKAILSILIIVSAIWFQLFFISNSANVFWILFGCYFCLLSATLPILDKVVLDLLEGISASAVGNYGRQRLWSTIGYIVTNISVEKIICDEPGKEDFSNLMWYNPLLAFFTAILVFLLVDNKLKSSSNFNYMSSAVKLIKNLDFMYLIFVILLSGISRAAMTIYLGDYYSQVLKFDKSLPEFIDNLPSPLAKVFNFAYSVKQSTTTIFGVTCELIIFFYAKFITEKIGLIWPILIAQIFHCLRFIAYFLLDYNSKWSFEFACLFELLKGAGFGLIQSSAAILATKYAPPSLKTTAHIIYNGAYIALGSVLSGLIFNMIFKSSSEISREQAYNEFRNVFAINAIFCFAIIVLLVIKYVFVENLLLSKKNLDDKILAIETRHKLEEDLLVVKE